MRIYSVFIPVLVNKDIGRREKMLKKYMKTALDGEDLDMVSHSAVMNTEHVGERCILQRHDQVIGKINFKIHQALGFFTHQNFPSI